MGRKVKQRLSLAADVTYLSRLIQALESDTKYELEWRRQLIGVLQHAIAIMMAPLSRVLHGENGENGEDEEA